MNQLRHLLKYVFLLCIVMTGLQGYGQSTKSEFDAEHWQGPYQLTAPDNWTVERFPIPIEFAPSIPYTGVEDLRFAPGWGKPDSEEYWTYSFLWFLKGKQTFTAGAFNQHLQAYYTGLVGRNIEPRKIPRERAFPVSVSVKSVALAPGDKGTYEGTIHMLDYMQQKPITLNCVIHVRECGDLNNSFVFYEISPQPRTHAIWQTLDKIWSDFVCKPR